MQRNMNPKMMFSISLIALISGCGGSDDGNNNSLVPDNELIISEDETNTTELEGTWLKSCSAVDENDPDTLYDIVEATFNNNKFNSSIYNYIDSHCTTALSFSPNPTANGTLPNNSINCACDNVFKSSGSINLHNEPSLLI